MRFTGVWSAPEAVLNLYFSDDTSTRKGKARREAMMRAVGYAFAEMETTVAAVTPIEVNRIKHIVKTIREFRDCSAKTAWHPLLWLRFAIRHINRLPISGYLLSRFSNWRDNHPEQGAWKVTYLNQKTGKYQGKRGFGEAYRKKPGFTLEEFLLSAELKTESEADPYLLSWHANREPRGAQPGDAKRKKSPEKKYSDEVVMRRHCGTQVLDEVKRCVKLAAKSDKPFLSPTLVGGRYPCKASRRDLATWLKSKYDSLRRYEITTLERTVSAIATCPKGNSKSRMKIRELRR